MAHWSSAIASAHSKMSGARERVSSTTREAFKYAEVGGAAFAWGYANARYTKAGSNELALAGIPADAGAAIVLGGLAFAGLAGREYDPHLHNLAAGSLASFLARKGGIMGAQAFAKAQTSTAGALGQGVTNRWHRARQATYVPVG